MLLLLLLAAVSGQQFHEPGPPAPGPPAQPYVQAGAGPKPRGPSPKRHHHQVYLALSLPLLESSYSKRRLYITGVTTYHLQDIHLDMEKEREHVKAQVKTDYLDTEGMDDNALLMQYFRLEHKCI